uniref:Uncharacterized protein n=1 Tax=Tetranychus urticae TaxID=32264 RepID=T1JZP1_TETUR
MVPTTTTTTTITTAETATTAQKQLTKALLTLQTH